MPMRYRSYGKNGPEVSVLGFGAMRLPTRKKGDWGRPNYSKAVPLIRRALEQGVNFLDSHHGYHGGNSEVAIGRALKGWKGHRVYIQTKTPFYNNKPLKHFKQLIEEALEKTQVECIDYLLFHSMVMDTFKKRSRQFFKLTDWAMKKGYIRHRGFSSHDKPEQVKQFIDTGEFSAMLLSYNWLNPQMADMIAYGASKGLGVSVMNPVGGGALAVDTKQILNLLTGAKTAPEVALRYVMGTPGVAVTLSGMSTVEQVDQNVAIAERRSFMTSQQRRQMRQRLAAIKKKTMAVCTACGYCMPCPHGVDIPLNFTLYNQAHYLGLIESGRGSFKNLHDHPQGDRSALACKQCGKCLPKCPNNVPIIEQLAQTAELLGNA